MQPAPAALLHRRGEEACGLPASSACSWTRSPAILLVQQRLMHCSPDVPVVAHSVAEPSMPSAAAMAMHHAPPKMSEVLANAGRKALGGGVPAVAAMTVQVFSLMWLRTTINYQYRYGLTTSAALRTLYQEGGVVRFYRGLLPALLQGPLSRFGDTAANAGTLALLESYPSTAHLPVGVKTLAASASAGAFRVLLMPIDALKTIMQVEGAGGGAALAAKVRAGGPTVLYHGAMASALATFVGHYPWFATYNTLDLYLPKPDRDAPLHHKLMRSAFMGFCSSLVSDCVSNSVRVVKTAKQASTVPVTYKQVVKEIVDKEGVLGLMGRGLKTKLVANGMQGIMFTVVWRLGQDWWAAQHTKSEVKEEGKRFQSQGHAR